jgi:hypothetical protein
MMKSVAHTVTRRDTDHSPPTGAEDLQIPETTLPFTLTHTHTHTAGKQTANASTQQSFTDLQHGVT